MAIPDAVTITVLGVAMFYKVNYMENIISDILKIEESACKRLADAEKESIKIIADAKAEKEALINASLQKAKDRINSSNDKEKSRIEKQLYEIEQNKIAEINRINSIYDAHHTEWENKIFEQIING